MIDSTVKIIITAIILLSMADLCFSGSFSALQFLPAVKAAAAPPATTATSGSGGGKSSSSGTNSSSNANCSLPAPVNTNNSELKVNVLPPRIVMNYAGIEYDGDLSEAKYRAGINFPELHIRPQNITANVPSNIVHVQKDSCIQFLIRGTPKLLPPSSLAVTAYSAISGAAAKVLNATDYDSSIFRMNLNSGNYILLAAATWLPGSEDVTGYVIYKFVASVVG
jgi:hypothetical protein